MRKELKNSKRLGTQMIPLGRCSVTSLPEVVKQPSAVVCEMG